MTERGRRLRILAVGDERTASTRYRILAHLETLREAGFEVDLRLEGEVSGPGIFRRAVRLRRLVLDTPRPGTTDVLVIHRRTFPPPFHRLVKRSGAAIVFDMDDALDLPPPGHPATARELRRYRRNFLSTVAVADLVICGNPHLAQRVPHERTTVIETPVDCARFNPQAVRGGPVPVIGWVGHSDNLPFLESLREVFLEVVGRHPGTRIKVVADSPPELRGLDVDYQPWTLASEVSCFDTMTIGLMPLDNTQWTRSKCAFKLLQYMALGIPAIASPVGMNAEVVDHGVTGFLARTPEEWLGAIDGVLSNPATARSVAERARRLVTSKYSLDGASARFIDALCGLERPVRAS